MEPACLKMTLLVFLAVFAMRARSQTQHSIGSYTTSETKRCVCQPHVTINPPVCGRSVPVNSGTGCNSTTVQEILRIVSGNNESVSFELEDTRRKVDELQAAVSSNQDTVSSELKETRRKVDELQVAVSGNHELVFSEQQDMKRQLDLLQTAVTSIVGLLTVSSALIFKDCSDARTRGVTESGVYTVKLLDSGEPFHVYCDMDTDGGGWTVFQRRRDGSVDFYLDFANYSQGFGNLNGEFWLGNDKLHRLTAQGNYELRVQLMDFENSTGYAVYDSFSIADLSDNYRLTVGNYSGTAGDKLAFHNNQAFTTKDRDNGDYGSNCAEYGHGAWWYGSCYRSNLNGRYFNEATSDLEGIKWQDFSGYRSLKTTEMKIRSKD